MNLLTTNYQLQTERGYIALMSAIIISMLLLAITVSLGFSGFFSRLNILDSESKERSSALAEACGGTAMLKIIQNPAYAPSAAFDFSHHDFTTQTGGESVRVSLDHCMIASVVDTGVANQKAIKTQAAINKSYTNLRIVIDTTDFSIASWEECSNLTSLTTGC